MLYWGNTSFKMKSLIILLIFQIAFISCNKSSSSTPGTDWSESTTATTFVDTSEDFNAEDMEISDDEDVQKYLDATGDYPDGTYCAEVEYYNYSTGTRNSYDLDVEVENGDLVQIDWPNGGWLDSTHFTPENISTGEVSFRSDNGYNYTVTLGSFGGGCSGGYQLRNSVNNDIEEEEQKKVDETCPSCGSYKYTYDEICSSCKRKIEDEKDYTCPQCGGRKFSTFDEVCDDCERRNESEE